MLNTVDRFQMVHKGSSEKKVKKNHCLFAEKSSNLRTVYAYIHKVLPFINES